MALRYAILLPASLVNMLSMTPLLIAIVSAMWGYWHFVSRREGEPGAEIDVNVDFVGQQQSCWLIAVSATLTNRSFVRHNYSDFHLKVRYLLASDEIADGDKKINYQLKCTHTIDERLKEGSRCFANSAYIDPKLTFRHSYITYVPAEATFLWVQCKMQFPTKRHWLRSRNKLETKNTQRLFKVPG